MATAASPGLGQFPALTDAEREIEKMVQGRDEDIDLALANWLIVADIPEFSNLTRHEYLGRLDAMEQQVRQEMDRMKEVAVARGKNLNDPEVRCAIFCNAILKLKFAYAEEFATGRLTKELIGALYSNPDNIFLAGLIRTRRGSCISMPLLYLVLGQRFGFPIYLVGVGQHCFVRWQEGSFRLNIETTTVEKVSVTADDSVYLDAEGLRKEDVRGNVLRNMTRREVLGELFYARAAFWLTRGPNATMHCYDLSRARHLAPDNPQIEMVQHTVFNRYGIQPWHRSLEITPKVRK